MAIIAEERGTDVPGDDDAIAALHTAFARQKAAFLDDPYPSPAARVATLRALIDMMLRHEGEVVAAMQADFASHPATAAAMVEVHGVVARAETAIAALPEMMAPSARAVDPALFGTASAEVRYQPKGVIGNIVPWNFPFDLAIGPLIDMLAAGNRAIIKPSEYTPACARLMARMVAETFDPTLVTVAEGGLELSRAFCDLRWDHLLYTGSPDVGRQVMMAAARNLVPVTLELGGKCPAFLTPGSVTADSVADVIGTKLIKNGQMCISVDYALVPRAEVDAFVALAGDHIRRTAPDYSRSDDCTGIVSDRHMDRIEAMIADARDHGATVIAPEDGGITDRATRRMPLTLVIDPDPATTVMREEIFGPILPVVPYDDVDDGIARINAGERPLGLYVFGADEAMTARVVDRTSSGGAAINCCAMQGALPNMGFGGIGNSGMGRHHGVEGFREFSNPRGVFTRGTGDAIAAFHPPYRAA
ncbi:aldehyde dehydrogenase [Sphingomonas sp. Leaf412]|uniref:aldehyde dehydrogenase family protein n=1 Tax=Sphingomonas sp. Leaf412 TaxID=1736370 RepID=UPI0006FD0882|nr:aldehyde dehydrogenase family protein [Sphingomonas sp. Leaf412]KQT35301.1 aldehyde dehydrogenase [Sphingomonas sp. Leaf412]